MEKMWVEAFVSERDIRFVFECLHITACRADCTEKSADKKCGAMIKFRVDAYPGKVMPARIFHVEDHVDEETRMIGVLCECDNPDKILRAGMFATVTINVPPQPKIIIPGTAIMQGEKQNFVFVKTSKTSFEKRYVDVEIVVDDKAVLTSGLQEGEEIISNGGVYIISNGGFFIR
jgi:cobalt-zinc-cadmium efflux system membrane fusion protein